MKSRSRSPWLAVLVLAGATTQAAYGADGGERTNFFDDPFFQVSSGLADCPVPLGPLYTAAEVREQMHSRLERGTSCWLAGRCKDSNAYRYDKAIAPEVRKALIAVPGLRRSSVWVTIQRRWVYLHGCVPTREMAKRLESAAHAVPDVETVVPDLMVGTRGKPPYQRRTTNE